MWGHLHWKSKMWTGNRTILNVSNKYWYTGWLMLSKKDWSIKSLQLWKMLFSLLHRSSYQSISVHLPQSQSWTASAYRVWKLNKMMDSPVPIHCLCLNRKLFHHDLGMHNKYKTTILKAFRNQPLKPGNFLLICHGKQKYDHKRNCTLYTI